MLPNQKKATQLRNLSFNRYLVFRYATALFFFSNLYWLILLLDHATSWLIFPLVLLIGMIAVTIEQTSKYWHSSNRLFVTKIVYSLQLVANGGNILMILLGYQHLVFPFISPSGSWLLLLIQLVGCFLCLFLERRIWLIEHNKDAYLRQLKILTQAIQKEG